MRLAWPVPRHLIGSLLVSIAALALVHLSPTSLREELSALALILVFLVPGYLALLWAYPGKSDLSRPGRAVLSLAASVFLAGLLGLLLTATPRGLQSASLATLLSLFSIFLFAVAYLRWSDKPRSRRFFLLPRRGLRPGPNARTRSINGRRAAYASLILAVIFIAALTLFFGPHHLSLGDISSQFQEPLPDHQAGKDERLLTLTKEDRSQVDLAADVSLENGQITAASQGDNNSSQADAIALTPANNTSRDISGSSRQMASFGGGSGGTGGSSAAGSSKSQSKDAPSSKKEPESASASGKDGDNNLSAEDSASNQISIHPSMNQTDNLIPPEASGTVGAAPGLDLSSSANSSPEEGMKATQLNEAEISPEQNTSEPTSNSNATSSLPELPLNASFAEPPQTEAIQSGSLQNASSNSNQPPILKALMPDRLSPQPPGTAVLWKADATDYEGDKIFYKFMLNGREANGWSRIGNWIWLTSDLSPGDYQISVLVRDGSHASESSFDDMINSSFALRPKNQPPALQDLRSDSSSPMDLGGSITWTARAIDPDNDTVYYKFLKNGQEASGWATSPAWIWDTASESPGEYVISVLARDGLHASEGSFDSSMEKQFALTVSNGIPAISEMSADRPSPQPQGTAVIWTASALDPEGDPINYRFLVDDVPAGEWSTSNSWTWNTSASPIGIHSIKSQVRDGKHAPNSSSDSSKEAAFNITAANKPPILASLSPDPASPQAQGTTIAWTAGAADREGDRIFYKFLLNGRDMTGWSESPTWKWSSQGMSLGDYRVRVMVRDGRHAPEGSFDDYKESTFTLISEIDMQIERLQKK